VWGRTLAWRPQCQTQQTSSFEAASKPEDVLGPTSSKEGADKRGSEKKPAAVQPSQIQDLLRWNKTVRRLSTQKYIAMCAYIFFCICKNVAVKLTVVSNFIIASKPYQLT
jgi:hypothetical protein